MNFKVENNKNHTTFRCSFEKLDSLVAPELKALFLDQLNKGSNTFVVDLSQIKYCDSSGLSALLVGNRILKDKKGQFIIFGLNPMVEKIINISQLDTVFNIFNSEDDALNNLI